MIWEASLGKKNFDLFILFSLSLYSKDFFLFVSLIAKKNANTMLINALQIEKGTSRQRSGKGAIRKRFPLQKPRWEKNQTNNQALIRSLRLLHVV